MSAIVCSTLVRGPDGARVQARAEDDDLSRVRRDPAVEHVVQILGSDPDEIPRQGKARSDETCGIPRVLVQKQFDDRILIQGGSLRIFFSSELGDDEGRSADVSNLRHACLLT
jgi:hypothetical protein